MTEPAGHQPRPAAMLARPALIDPAFDDPEAVIALCRRSAPYSLAAAVQESAESGTDLPWFRTYWARGGDLLEPAAAGVFHNPRFIEASKAAFSASVVMPVSMMVNLNAPMASGAAHVDLPDFRGAERFPFDLRLAMISSGLFEAWALPTASTVSWFHRGEGGDFDYWPDGPQAPRRRLRAPLWNVALLGDNERMVHQMCAVGSPADRLAPGAVSREARLLADEGGRGWTLVDGDRRRRLGEDDVRISILWKAYAFETEGDFARFRGREDDLILPMALAIIDRDLARRGLERLDLDRGYDAAASLQVHAAYPQPRLNGDAPSGEDRPAPV